MTTDDMGLTPANIERFYDFLHKTAGIRFSVQNSPILSDRVYNRMRTLGLKDFEEYYRLVEADVSGKEVIELLNAISTRVMT